MNSYTRVMRPVALATLLLLPLGAQADCATEQTLCEARCSLNHYDDRAARAGCNSRCLAERAACSTQKGAEQAVDLSKQAWRDTRSFFQGLTEDKEERKFDIQR